jgi:hypothetical protein
MFLPEVIRLRYGKGKETILLRGSPTHIVPFLYPYGSIR